MSKQITFTTAGAALDWARQKPAEREVFAYYNTELCWRVWFNRDCRLMSKWKDAGEAEFRGMCNFFSMTSFTGHESRDAADKIKESALVLAARINDRTVTAAQLVDFVTLAFERVV